MMRAENKKVNPKKRQGERERRRNEKTEIAIAFFNLKRSRRFLQAMQREHFQKGQREKREAFFAKERFWIFYRITSLSSLLC